MLEGAPVSSGSSISVAVGAAFVPRLVSLAVTAESGVPHTHLL
jgi:hypothetical protein